MCCVHLAVLGTVGALTRLQAPWSSDGTACHFSLTTNYSLVRTSESTRGGMALVEKRARSPTGDNEGALIETKKSKSDALSVNAVPRTSTLHSPIMVLTGHGGEVRENPRAATAMEADRPQAVKMLARG